MALARAGASLPPTTTRASCPLSSRPCGVPAIASSLLMTASQRTMILQLPDIDLLISNTRLGVIDGAELMRRTRKTRPDMPILHVVHGNDPDGDTPPGVPILHEPFTPNQLLLAVGKLLT